MPGSEGIAGVLGESQQFLHLPGFTTAPVRWRSQILCRFGHRLPGRSTSLASDETSPYSLGCYRHQNHICPSVGRNNQQPPRSWKNSFSSSLPFHYNSYWLIPCFCRRFSLHTCLFSIVVLTVLKDQVRFPSKLFLFFHILYDRFHLEQIFCQGYLLLSQKDDLILLSPIHTSIPRHISFS